MSPTFARSVRCSTSISSSSKRVWLLKPAPSISPVDSGGENIWLDYNEGVVYRIRPRYNADVNTWWISDDTRYSYKAINDPKRLSGARKTQYGTQVETDFTSAIDLAGAELKRVHKEGGDGSLYAMLSPMMACEEAWLLGTLIRSIDPSAVLILGPVPATAEDEVFKNPSNGKVTFTIKAEKVPNAAGIRRVIEMLGGPTASWDDFVKSESAALKNLKGGWIVGGYLSAWLPKDAPAQFKKGSQNRAGHPAKQR